MKDRGDSDRRRVTRGGRRDGDLVDDSVATALNGAATVLWNVPGGARCSLLQYKGRQVVYISTREQAFVRIEIFDSESEARTHAAAWQSEYRSRCLET